MEEVDNLSENLYNNIDKLQRSLYGRRVIGLMQSMQGQMPEPPADVFIIRAVLDGSAQYDFNGDHGGFNGLSKVWNSIVQRIASNSRTTHWAAEIRGDLYETFRHKEYRWLWSWKATLRFTAAEDRKDNTDSHVVERVRIGRTTLSNQQIANIGKEQHLNSKSLTDS
jgi:hypothetical protein